MESYGPHWYFKQAFWLPTTDFQCGSFSEIKLATLRPEYCAPAVKFSWPWLCGNWNYLVETPVWTLTEQCTYTPAVYTNEFETAKVKKKPKNTWSFMNKLILLIIHYFINGRHGVTTHLTEIIAYEMSICLKGHRCEQGRQSGSPAEPPSLTCALLLRGTPIPLHTHSHRDTETQLWVFLLKTLLYFG